MYEIFSIGDFEDIKFFEERGCEFVKIFYIGN